MYAHYDRECDIAWFRFEPVEPNTMFSEQTGWGLRDLDRASGKLVGLEFWRASDRLPQELLDALPAPKGQDVVITRDELAKHQPHVA